MKIIQKLKDCWDVVRNKPRIIKMKLPSKRTFLEFDERVLYSTIDCLRFYIEEDRGDHVFKSKEEANKEIEKYIKSGDPYNEETKNHIFEIASFEEKLTEIYNWWNKEYLPFQIEGNVSTDFNKNVDRWIKEDEELEKQADEYLEFLMKNRRRIWC